MSGAIGTFGTVLAYDRPWLDVWLAWVISDGLGVLVVVPVCIGVAHRTMTRRTRGERFGLIVLLAMSIGLAFADIGGNGRALLPYLILVGLIWAGMRFGSRSVAVAGFVVGLGANIAIPNGYGPFTAAAGADVITLHTFLAVALITSFVVSAMAGELADRDEVHRLLTHQATHDALTGLPNRVLFGERLDSAIADSSRAEPPPSVVLIDIDGFKKVNDLYGHRNGDAALIAVAQRLRGVLGDGDTLARIGGAEFAVVSRGVEGATGARALAASLLATLGRPIDIGGSTHVLVGRAGIALADPDATSVELIRRADVTLHHVKGVSGGSLGVFDEGMDALLRRRLAVHQELIGAVARGELSIAYQPIVSLTTGRVVEFEALARWRNRRFGVVGPDEFIGIAEDSGLIVDLGDWVLETACRQLASWRSGGHGTDALDAHLAVNVSPHQLADPGFAGRVAAVLTACDLPPRTLTLEITETAVMDEAEGTRRALAELRAMGVLLSMDDFGTGYSSMSNLRRLPLHTLKIDRTFVGGLGDIAGDTSIVGSIIDLGHSFGLGVVAEGVETQEQRAHLIALGCDRGQGYLWSRPTDGETARGMLEEVLPVATAPAVRP